MFFLLFLASVIAFCLSAICGGGASLLLIPILGSLLSPAQIPAAISIGTFFSSASRIAVFYRNIRWKVVMLFVPAAVPAVFAGALLLRYLNPLYIEVAMGIFLVGNLPSLFKKAEVVSDQRNSPGPLAVIGFFAGFLSGLTGAVGLVFNRFYLRYGLSKEEIVATRAANEILLHVIKLVLYASFGLLTTESIGIGGIIAMAALISSFVMKRGLKKISEGFFQKIGYLAMVVAGVSMLSQATAGIFLQNDARLSLQPVSSGFESKLQWKKSNLALEFEYNEGFEFERKIELADLPAEKRAFVESGIRPGERMYLEEVFGIDGHSYEVYYFNDKNEVRKFDF